MDPRSKPVDLMRLPLLDDLFDVIAGVDLTMPEGVGDRE